MRICVAIFVLLSITSAQQPLGVYDVDWDEISVSGLSSGASMATQFHVAYSSQVMGVAMYAGSPYWCAQGMLGTATGACMSLPSLINLPNIHAKVAEYEASGDIDPVVNMLDDKVFLWHGSGDPTVAPGVLPHVVDFYTEYVDEENIEVVSNINSGHNMPTSYHGNACTTSRADYIANCDYPGAFYALDHIYGNLEEPTSYGGVLPGTFYTYDQREFFDYDPSVSSMDTEGYVYVPSGCNEVVKKSTKGSCDIEGGDRVNCGFAGVTPEECEDDLGCCYDDSTPDVPWCYDADEDPPVEGQCRLHVVFHGCLQGKYLIDDEYARNTGYNEVAELNNIIMLYPQADRSLSNMNGCWDWWGYNTPNVYATKGGHQPLAICRMIAKLVGSNREEYCGE